jgi:hypothetical protein
MNLSNKNLKNQEFNDQSKLISVFEVIPAINEATHILNPIIIICIIIISITFVLSITKQFNATNNKYKIIK